MNNLAKACLCLLGWAVTALLVVLLASGVDNETLAMILSFGGGMLSGALFTNLYLVWSDWSDW